MIIMLDTILLSTELYLGTKCNKMLENVTSGVISTQNGYFQGKWQFDQQ